MLDFNKVAETFNRMTPEPERQAYPLFGGNGVQLKFWSTMYDMHIFSRKSGGFDGYFWSKKPTVFSTFNEALVEGMKSCGVGREEQAEIKRAFGIGE
jgi:hypothetical protein